MYESLTKHIGRISPDRAGRVVSDRRGEGNEERPYEMPYVENSSAVDAFVRDLYAFVKAHGEFELTEYQSILERNGIRWDERAMTQAPAESLDAECIPALLLGAVRADRFSDGALLSFIQSGSIEKWLKQLDKQNGIERC